MKPRTSVSHEWQTQKADGSFCGMEPAGLIRLRENPAPAKTPERSANPVCPARRNNREAIKNTRGAITNSPSQSQSLCLTFSNHWKLFSRFFQSLETFSPFFQSLETPTKACVMMAPGGAWENSPGSWTPGADKQNNMHPGRGAWDIGKSETQGLPTLGYIPSPHPG